MPKFLFNLNKIEQERRNYFVFYATHEIIVYNYKNKIIMDNCSGERITEIGCPDYYRIYSVVDLGDILVIVFSGKYLVCLDKFGDNSFANSININRVGRIISDIFKSDHANSILFAGHLHGKIHFLNYDFLANKRVSQSASWKVGRINDMQVKDNKIFAIMDSAYLVCCDAHTCEALWTRFETGKIEVKALSHNERLIYSCQNLLKIYKNNRLEIVRVPLARPNTLEYISQDKLYYTSRDQKHLCCLDLTKRELIWEITGTEPIKKTIAVQGKLNGSIYDMMVIQTTNAITVANLSLGKVHSHFKVSNLQNIKLTGDHILIHRKFNHTDMIPGIRQGTT